QSNNLPLLHHRRRRTNKTNRISNPAQAHAISSSRRNNNSKTSSRALRDSNRKKINGNSPRINSHQANLGATKIKRRKSKRTKLRQRTSHKKISSNNPVKAPLLRQARKRSKRISPHRRLENGRMNNHRVRAKEKMKRLRREKVKVERRIRHRPPRRRNRRRGNSLAN